MALHIQKLRSTAQIPARATSGAAGYDLYADLELPLALAGGGGYTKIPTGVAVRIPPGHYGRIAPRSGNAANLALDVGAGVIDTDYSGEIIVLLQNTHVGTTVAITHGMKVAQLVIECCSTPEVKVVDVLPASGHADHAGFGSTDGVSGETDVAPGKTDVVPGSTTPSAADPRSAIAADPYRNYTAALSTLRIDVDLPIFSDIDTTVPDSVVVVAGDSIPDDALDFWNV